MEIILSIIVPTYNVEKFIGRCASSILSQISEGVEVIFINDCSSDTSESIIYETIKKYPSLTQQIRVVRTQKNSGIAAVRNLGIELANGEYIYQVDGDDYLEENSLLKLIEYLKYTKPDVLLFDYYLNIDNKKISIQNGYDRKDKFLNSLLCSKISPSIWNKVFKKNIVIRNGLKFNEGKDYGEDYFFVPQLIDNAENINSYSEKVYNYNVYVEGSYTRGISEKKILDLNFNMEKLKIFFNGEKDILINEAYINKTIDFIWKINTFNDLKILKKIVKNFSIKETTNEINFFNKFVYKMYCLNLIYFLYFIVKFRQIMRKFKKILKFW